MGNRARAAGDLFAGRVDEQARLGEVLSASAKGLPALVLVQGEAGVGKTRLVREVTEQYRIAGRQVLSGTCVHFGAASVPFAPVIQALDGWSLQVDPAVPSVVLEDADALSILLPSMRIRAAEIPPRQLLPVVDTVLQRLAAKQPTVLVVDNLQWADVSSLDMLADMRRLPGCLSWCLRASMRRRRPNRSPSCSADLPLRSLPFGHPLLAEVLLSIT